ncbi:MAG: HAMP domain-containing protein [Rhodospirillales bacterium]|nr:HAMP domain-containing protein [Rhodospirillales bacterium]
MEDLFNRFLPRGLLARALLIAVGPLILMQLLSAYVFYNSHWDQVSKRLSQGLAGDIAVLVDSLTGMPDSASRDWLFREAAQRMEISATLQSEAILPNAPVRQTALEGELRRALLRKQITKPMRVDEQTGNDRVVVLVQLADGVLHLEIPRHRLYSWTTYAFVLWTIGTTLILLGVATIFMRNQIRPVRRLARVADSFGKGREVENFKPEGAREVKLVGLAFLAMKSRIQRQIAQRTAMLAGVSHDLRTPLTRMKLQLEMMPEDDAAAALREDVHDMERMLEGYLAFARGEGVEKAHPRDLGVLLGEVVNLARRGGAMVDLSTEGDLRLPLRPNAIRRSFTNLVDNALRFASRVAVRARRMGGAIEVTIDDDGPGVPADQREEVFKPFFRLEASRNPATGGVGLGLTIARDVVRGHGGDILLDDSPQGGLRVCVRLPV